MASRNSKSSAGSGGRPEAPTKGAKASMQASEMKSERAKGSSGGASSKRSSMGGEKKSSGSKSSK